MSIIILIPGVVCILALLFRSPAWVFRYVVLPSILLLPLYYEWKVALLPPLDFADAVLLPLGIAMAIRSMPRWRFSILDLFLVLFALSQAAGDRILGQSTASVFEFFDSLSKVVVPYMVGKLLIEQDNARSATLKQIVTLIFAASLVGMYEFRGLNNPWRMVFGPFFKGELIPWATQLRGGSGRISVSFAQAEVAGMMIVYATLLAIFLGKHYHWGERFRSMPALSLRKSSIVILLLVLALFMTQSRGPELALVCAIPIAFIVRSRHVLRTAILVVLLMVAAGGVAYESLVKYAATNAPTSEEQETAAYRAVMIKNYLPMAEHSGPWGLGPHFPVIGKYQSVDNEYLFVALTDGYIGLGSFLILSGGTLYNLVMAAAYNPQKLDRAFAFTLLGLFVGILVCLATVYLGFQPFIFFFMTVGWAQTVRVRPAPQPFAVFEQVYT
jgi:hypothetical protein